MGFHVLLIGFNRKILEEVLFRLRRMELTGGQESSSREEQESETRGMGVRR